MTEEIEETEPTEDPCCNQMTPDKVQLIAEKVYKLWQRDLRIANERRQLFHKTTFHSARSVR